MFGDVIEKIMYRIVVLYDDHIDKQQVRFMLLIVAGGFGLLVGSFADIQFFCDYLGQDKEVAKYLATAVFGVFVFTLLWYFRTRDVRQQIEKTQEQINKFQIQIWQNKIDNAIENLNSDSIIKQKVGTQSLINLLDITPEFNNLIIFAFVSASNKFNYNRSYIDYTEHPCSEKLIEDISHYHMRHRNPDSYRADNFHSEYIDKKTVRFLLLIVTGCFGLLLGTILDSQFFLDSFVQDEEVAEYLATAVVGIFIFILLWYFRTRDIRQQVDKTQEPIEKYQEQIWQNRFNSAIGNLSSGIIAQEEMGVQLLIMLSEVTTEFNELITIAFESTTNEFQRNISKTGGKYYISKKRGEYFVDMGAINPDVGIKDLKLGDEQKFCLGISHKEDLLEFFPRKGIILFMHAWLSTHPKPKEEQDDKSLR